MYDIIKKKRDGGVLSREEIRFFVKGYVSGEIPDYQVSALLMAIFFNKLNKEETAVLTEAMAESGEQMDLSAVTGIKVDKHSTGGVGDKTTLVLAPLVASAGIPIAKMSGRGLGHTGGTIDKLESIPGFRAEMTKEEFIGSVNRIGIAITGQTGNIAPADKKLYALRDVTATVDNMSLIASSIMSKKLAAGADCILLDVKVGRGAFMKNVDEARELAKTMVDIGVTAGRRTVAVISDMSQPLGNAVGNALEVKEAIETIMGKGPEDFDLLCRELGAVMLVLGGKAENADQGKEIVEELFSSGKVLKKFREFVENQGGNPEVVDSPEEILPRAGERLEIPASMDGYIGELYAEEIGLSAMLLGAGRAKKGDSIDPSVGIVLHKKVGDAVKKGESIASFHINKRDNLDEACRLFESAVKITKEPVSKVDIIKEFINRP
jgi:pyrimidine-nucleoside phosphorylase